MDGNTRSCYDYELILCSYYNVLYSATFEGYGCIAEFRERKVTRIGGTEIASYANSRKIIISRIQEHFE